MGLIEDCGRGPVGLDTVVFIYFIEEHPRYLPIVEPLFHAVAEGRIATVTSSLTMLETLVVPYRVGDLPLAERYEMLLGRSQGLSLIRLDHTLLRAAAQVRARYGVRTPDALQLAAAIIARCSAYVTNDRDLPTIAGLRIVQLRDYAQVRAGAATRSSAAGTRANGAAKWGKDLFSRR
jgi:predicted nucleic acid-binding protein